MKCTYCHHDILKGEVTCTTCGRHIPVYEKFRIDRFNCFLIVLSIIQIIIAAFFVVRLFNGSIVESYLKSGEYESAVSLINKYEFLQNRDNITEQINSIISDVEKDYFNGKITYDSAEKALNVFSSISDSNYQQRIYAVKNTISTENDTRDIIESGDKALSDNDYDNAITQYKSILEKYPDSNVDIDEKINTVINQALTDFDKYAKKGNYSKALDTIDELDSNCKNIELKGALKEWKKDYLYDWIQDQNANHEYVGNEGSLQLSIMYDSLNGDTSLSKTIDTEYQSYIQENIESNNFDQILKKLDSDYENICKFPEYFDSSTYNNYRLICSSKLLEEVRSDKKYTGTSGAIKLCDKVNSYQEGAVDKKVIISEYASIERTKLFEWINELRSSKGLSKTNYSSSLESAASEIILHMSDDTYDDNTFKAIMESNGISYTRSYSAWNSSSATAETMENGFNPVENFGLLTEDGLTEIGIGMVYNEDSSKFSWFIIGIK